MYLDAVVGLFVHNGEILPAEFFDNFTHRDRLVEVARDGPREVLEPLLVGQLRRGRKEGDLWEKLNENSLGKRSL